MSGFFSQIGAINANSWVFLLLSGASTGASWICYFRALSCDDVNKAVPIEKSSAALASLAAVFAAFTSLFGKMGMEGINSNLGTAIRTCVVLAMAFGIVIAHGKPSSVASVWRRETLFLLLSGIATGASWMLFYFALQTGVVSAVVQIDKLSILISIAFAYFAFGERLSRRSGIGLTIIVIGTITLTAISR